MTEVEGEVRILALRNVPREYEIFPSSTEGTQASIDFLMEAGGGTIYKLEFVKDKYDDVIPKCERLGVV